MSIPILHPLYGEGEIIDYRAGESLFSFPGSLKLWEKGHPSELIYRFHRGQYGRQN